MTHSILLQHPQRLTAAATQTAQRTLIILADHEALDAAPNQVMQVRQRVLATVTALHAAGFHAGNSDIVLSSRLPEIRAIRFLLAARLRHHQQSTAKLSRLADALACHSQDIAAEEPEQQTLHALLDTLNVGHLLNHAPASTVLRIQLEHSATISSELSDAEATEIFTKLGETSSQLRPLVQIQLARLTQVSLQGQTV